MQSLTAARLRAYDLVYMAVRGLQLRRQLIHDQVECHPGHVRTATIEHLPPYSTLYGFNWHAFYFVEQGGGNILYRLRPIVWKNFRTSSHSSNPMHAGRRAYGRLLSMPYIGLY